MYLRCQSNTFPFFDQLNSDVSLINSNFINFRLSHDKNIFVDENLKTFLQSVIIETLSNDSDHSVSIDSKYHDIKDFNKLNINKNSSFATLNLNIVSLFKHFKDLENFLYLLKHFLILLAFQNTK